MINPLKEAFIEEKRYEFHFFKVLWSDNKILYHIYLGHPVRESRYHLFYKFGNRRDNSVNYRTALSLSKAGAFLLLDMSLNEKVQFQ